MIEGVAVKSLRVTPDERGRFIEILRSDDPLFERFGQVFASAVYPGKVKAWHCHKKQTDFLAVISGMAKVGLYDGREDSTTYGQTEEIFAGDHNPVFGPEPSRDWESHYTTSQTVMRLADGSWRMWYATRPAPPFDHKYYAIGTAHWAGPL